MEKGLYVFKFHSLGEGLQFVQNISDDQPVEVIEVTPLGRQSLVILQGKLYQFDITGFGNRAIYLENPHPSLLSSYLGLDSSPIKDNLLLVESEEPAQLFGIADQALRHSWKLVDFRVLRTHQSPSYLLVTCDSPDTYPWNFASLDAKISHFAHPTDRLRKFLDINV